MIAKLIIGLLIGFFLAVGLAQTYLFGEKIFKEYWISAAAFNTCFALVIYLIHKIFVKKSSDSRWLYYAPAVAVIGGSAALAVTTRLSGKAISWEHLLSAKQLAWIIWVPIVEEWVFRMGIGESFRRLFGPFIGAYVSALMFSFMHSAPTLPRLLNGHIGLFLGPFLLGLICEWIVYKSKRATPAIVLHMACNATVVIFGIIDARWLKWFQILYT